jgi:hypothetical protein
MFGTINEALATAEAAAYRVDLLNAPPQLPSDKLAQAVVEPTQSASEAPEESPSDSDPSPIQSEASPIELTPPGLTTEQTETPAQPTPEAEEPVIPEPAIPKTETSDAPPTENSTKN